MQEIADDVGSGNADEINMQVRIGSLKDLKLKFLSASKMHIDEQSSYQSTLEHSEESFDESKFREQFQTENKMLQD